MSKTIKPCQCCGSKAEVYVVIDKGFRVACLASDSEYHGTEGVIDDWCPGDCEGPIKNTQFDAVDAWNDIQIDKRITEIEQKIEQMEQYEMERLEHE